MVSEKAKDLKNQMCGEFSDIFHLCVLVLTTSTKKELVFATLETLLKFLNWVPLGFIFETDMIRILVEKVSFPLRRWSCSQIKKSSSYFVAVSPYSLCERCYAEMPDRDWQSYCGKYIRRAVQVPFCRNRSPTCNLPPR